TPGAADCQHLSTATNLATFHRPDVPMQTRTEIAVVPDDSAEVRRVTVTNNGEAAREVEITSYGEVVLAPPGTDRAHPAFANVFVETEWHEWCSALTASRRPRSSTEQTLWGVHLVSAAEAGDGRVGSASYETDRARFIGRGRSTRHPVVLD